MFVTGVAGKKSLKKIFMPAEMTDEQKVCWSHKRKRKHLILKTSDNGKGQESLS